MGPLERLLETLLIWTIRLFVAGAITILAVETVVTPGMVRLIPLTMLAFLLLLGLWVLASERGW